MSRMLEVGELAPGFKAPMIGGNPQFAFDTTAGRYLLLLFFGSARLDAANDALEVVNANAELFDDRRAAFFGISADPDDATEERVASAIPGRRFLMDRSGAISRRFGAVSEDARYRPYWLLLDIDLRVLATAPIDGGDALIARLRTLPHPDEVDRTAPVIEVPGIFEAEICSRLIELYDEHGGEDSGFMREIDGKTVGILDHSYKKREDWLIEDEELRAALRTRIERRLVPQIRKAFQFPVSRMERYIVARYDGTRGGFFRPHRDNTTAGTAHRRFACTINLNAEEYEGGDLRFPEFGRRTYRAPTGGAVVFSCSLLHEAMPVTRGARYCFLPFFYDEAAAEIRERNNEKLGDGMQDYRR